MFWFSKLWNVFSALVCLFVKRVGHRTRGTREVAQAPDSVTGSVCVSWPAMKAAGHKCQEVGGKNVLWCHTHLKPEGGSSPNICGKKKHIISEKWHKNYKLKCLFQRAAHTIASPLRQKSKTHFRNRFSYFIISSLPHTHPKLLYPSYIPLVLFALDTCGTLRQDQIVANCPFWGEWEIIAPKPQSPSGPAG